MSAPGDSFVLITPQLSHKLEQRLGAEGASEFMNWMQRTETRTPDVAELRADMAELRQEMQVGFAKLHEEVAHLETRFERRFGDLIKWSFVFWVGAVGAIAVLAGVLQ